MKIGRTDYRLLKDSERKDSVRTSAIRACAVKNEITAVTLCHEKWKVHQGSETPLFISLSEVLSFLYLR